MDDHQNTDSDQPHFEGGYESDSGKEIEPNSIEFNQFVDLQVEKLQSKFDSEVSVMMNEFAKNLPLD